MATNWITITDLLMSPEGTRVARTPRRRTHEFGDGYTARIPDGINNLPRTYTISYRYMTATQFWQLFQFVVQHAGLSTTLSIPVYPEDPSGATTAWFFIDTFDYAPVESGGLFDMTIVCQEVFIDG